MVLFAHTQIRAPTLHLIDVLWTASPSDAALLGAFLELRGESQGKPVDFHLLLVDSNFVGHLNDFGDEPAATHEGSGNHNFKYRVRIRRHAVALSQKGLLVQQVLKASQRL